MNVPVLSRLNPRAVAPLVLALGIAATGCRSNPNDPKHLPKPGEADSIDASWVNAARSCWSGVRSSGRSLADVRQYLLTASHFRSAFPAYAALSDDQLQHALSLPLATVLPPDTSRLAHSQTPVLTRGQAIAGVGPQEAVVASTNGSAPPDSLCSIQPGAPDGF